MPAFCGSGTGEAVDLYCLWIGPGLADGILGGGFSKPGVIGTDACRVAVAVDVAVEYYDGDSGVVHILYHGSQSLRFVGRYYYDVESVVLEIPYVVDLLLTAVVCGADFHFSVVMIHYFALYLFVHLHAPVVLAALRHSDPVFPVFMAGKECDQAKAQCDPHHCSD